MKLKAHTLALLAVFGSLVLVRAGLAATSLTVSAAASLTDAFEEIGKEFETKNPEVKIIFNFAASGVLLRQIERGAPVDVFASADQPTMDQAESKGLIRPDTRKDFAGNRLVLIAPRESGGGIKSVADLAGLGDGKVSIGNPETVPAGRYARSALKRMGLWDSLSDKLVFGESVRQSLDYVSREEVEAALVFATDAAASAQKVRVIAEVENCDPITYPIAVIGSSANVDLAKRFADYAAGENGRRVLLRQGFTEVQRSAP
jgi:molybdate transport system substrate-binding protein